MPLRIYDHMSHDYFINAKLHHLADALGEGQRCEVSSADPQTVKISPDSEPRNGPDGSLSVASGKVSIVIGATPNKSVVVTSHVSELRGAHAKDANGAVIPDAVDVVVFAPGPGGERRIGAPDTRPAPFVERRSADSLAGMRPGVYPGVERRHGDADTRTRALRVERRHALAPRAGFGTAEGSFFGVPAGVVAAPHKVERHK